MLKYNNIKLIIGLGNPGIKYKNNRHNIGKKFLYKIIKIYKKNIIYINKKFYFGNLFKLILKNKIFYLLLPNTFINLSGNFLLEIITIYNILPEQILVFHDDISLLLGKLKLIFNGYHFGHNGIKHIITILNTKKFFRLRIGINNNKIINNEYLKNFVLSNFSYYEKNIINHIFNKMINFIFKIWLFLKIY